MATTKVLLLAAALLSCAQNAPERAEQGSGGPAPKKDPYHSLRSKFLEGSRAGFKLPESKNPVWGVLMETGVEDGTVTVLAITDGTASIYLSAGGGYIGGGQHERVRSAAIRTIGVAREFLKSAKATTEYPLPKPGQVTFYLLTDQGVLTASAPEDDLGNRRVPLSKLFYAGQEIVTGYRLLDKRPR